MLTLIRLAARDLYHQRAFALFFVANLTFGLAGSITLDGLGASIERALGARSRAFLAGDLRISANRPLTDPEHAAFTSADVVATSDVVQTYSMVGNDERARLAEVRAIDANFPLAGDVLLATGPANPTDHRGLEEAHEAWADPSLLDQLDLELGDEVHIGTETFRITNTVMRDTGISVRAASLAPRLYVSRANLAATGLIQTGSRISYQRLFALAPGTDARATAELFRSRTTDPRVRVTSHVEAIEEISGAYRRVTRYLGLIALVALALAGIGCSYAFRVFLARRVPDLAILMSVGATRSRAQRLLLIELVFLATVAALVATLLAAIALPQVGAMLEDLLPGRIDLALAPAQAIEALIVATLIGPAFCMPLLVRLRSLRVAELFQEHARLALAGTNTEVLWYLPPVAALAGIAAWRSGDARSAAFFVGVIGAAFVVIAGLGRVLLGAVSRIAFVRSIPVRLALRQLSPARRSSLTAFVAISLCALLLALPSQLRALLDERLRPPAPQDIPSLFLFDIQPEQTAPLKALVAEHGTKLQRMAPMIRARLDAINGQRIDHPTASGETPSFGERRRLKSRRYNLTYQDSLAPTEKLVAGRDFSGDYPSDNNDTESSAEISMEVDFAARLGVGLGDALRFDVQGVPVDGRIINLRAVDWNSMQPNFFVSFQPGVLEGAPSVYLASIPALGSMERDRLQKEIVDVFPNISMIDVSRGVHRLLSLLDQLEWALKATAWTALAVGLLIVLAIARDEAEARRWDVNLMKILGASHRSLRLHLVLEFGMLSGAATLVGVLSGAAVAAAIAAGPLDVEWKPAWFELIAVLVSLPTLVVVAARIAMRPVLASRPQAFLR